MDPFIPTSNGQLVNIVPVMHKWSKKHFKEGTCYIEPGEETNFVAVEDPLPTSPLKGEE